MTEKNQDQAGPGTNEKVKQSENKPPVEQPTEKPKEPAVSNAVPLIYGKLLNIQEQIPVILKDKEFIINNHVQYKFRGIDDLYNALNPIFRKERVFMSSDILEHESTEKNTASGKLLFYEKLLIKYSLIAEDGSHVETTTKGIGMDTADKAANKAMSVAQKYALIQMFSIPTIEAKDPENDGQDVSASNVDLDELHTKLFNCNTANDLRDLYAMYEGDNQSDHIRALFINRKKQLNIK